MNTKFSAIVALLLSFTASLPAHRLDEYLQATIISVEQNRIDASMRLVPGVAVVPAVLANIDINQRRLLSEMEQRAYAERVLQDLSLTIYGNRLRPRLVSIAFPAILDMKEGLGEIELQFSADLPAGGHSRELVTQNHHQNVISVYLMNCLVPHDRSIRITGQARNENQSLYRLKYAQADVQSIASSSRSVGFSSIFRFGIRHIAEGTDHLLFLLTLLLPAPLLSVRGRWTSFADARHSLLKISTVVTAFTIGHSITLVFGGLRHGRRAKPSNRSANRRFDSGLGCPRSSSALSRTRSPNCSIFRSGSWFSICGNHR